MIICEDINTESTCESVELVKQGESIAVEVRLHDVCGNPITDLFAYTIEALIRSERVEALRFMIGDTESPVRSGIDKEGYIAFVLDGQQTASLLPGEYFLTMRLCKNNSAIDVRTKKIFSLAVSDMQHTGNNMLGIRSKAVVAPLYDREGPEDVHLEHRRQISVALGHLIDGFSPTIEGLESPDGSYRLRITTISGIFTTPDLNTSGGFSIDNRFRLVRKDASGGYDPSSKRYHYRIAIGNFEGELTDSSKYRLCYMYTRRARSTYEQNGVVVRSNRGCKWVVPMFGCIMNPKQNGVIEQTYIPITSRIVDVKLFSRAIHASKALFEKENGSVSFSRFRLTQTTRWRTGVAIFKYTGAGRPGWYRCSNIFGVELTIGSRSVVNIANINTSFIIE